jgi:hypothetical protein
MKSVALLCSYDCDHLGEEWTILRPRIMRSIGIDDTFRAWSQGFFSLKKFQQMTEESAEMIITQVWLREGHFFGKLRRSKCPETSSGSWKLRGKRLQRSPDGG